MIADRQPGSGQTTNHEEVQRRTWWWCDSFEL